MADRGVQNRLRHQRCPGIVEMQNFLNGPTGLNKVFDPLN
jgi:hypothetical protein